MINKIMKSAVVVAIAMMASVGVANAQSSTIAAPVMSGTVSGGEYDSPPMITLRCAEGRLAYTMNHTVPNPDPLMAKASGTRHGAKSGVRVFIPCKPVAIAGICIKGMQVSDAVGHAVKKVKNPQDLQKGTFKTDRLMAKTRGAHRFIGCSGIKVRKAKKAKKRKAKKKAAAPVTTPPASSSLHLGLDLSGSYTDNSVNVPEEITFRHEDTTPVYKKWWFWTLIGAATTGIVVGAVCGTGHCGGHTDVYSSGHAGATSQALGAIPIPGT